MLGGLGWDAGFCNEPVGPWVLGGWHGVLGMLWGMLCSPPAKGALAPALSCPSPPNHSGSHIWRQDLTPPNWAPLAWGPGAGWGPATVKSHIVWVTFCVAFPSRFALGRKTLVAFKNSLGPSPGAGCGARALPHARPQPFPRGFACCLRHRDLQTVCMFASDCIAVS